ncbi:MAG: bifunctional aspartate kinase/homoserine dehydrogenase I [Gammaproteobacteria bacterium]|nr:MAG: bifunctional aspartate kinase/homoserine dehydrogenase I [Gammaproteobacteria bacterium]
MSAHPWIVHKFGGSSLATAERFRRVGDIVVAQGRPRLAVVVSALGGFTDALLSLVAAASRGSEHPDEGLGPLAGRYREVAEALLPDTARAPLLAAFERDCEDIRHVLQALVLVRAASPRSRDLVSGYGELWSARLMAAYLAERSDQPHPVEWLDARQVLVVEPGEMGPAVCWEETTQRLEARGLRRFEGVAVITGFIASDVDGLQTTLGRDGSDYSASIFGALLGAEEINIWTDVNGVMSGDPRRVPEAAVINDLSYSEAMELAYFGARVLHPQTMAPAVRDGIPIRIRSTFDPEGPGTRVAADPPPGAQVKGVSAIDGVALINLEGSGMIGVPGTADRLFSALRTAGVSVILISQGSSEHSICFAVPEAAADQVRKVVEKAFRSELEQGLVNRVGVSRDCSILAVVGDGMAGLPGVAGRFFGTLGRAGINVRAIAQGASERNISAVVDRADAARAVRAVHSSFYLSAKTLSIGLIGPGTVGAAFLEQLAAERPRLRRDFNLDLRVRGIATSRQMLLASRDAELERWRELLDTDGETTDLERFVDHVQADHLPHAVIIDCTASAAVAARYAGWLGRGIHVITPNKRANSGPWSDYGELRRQCREHGSHYLYETTVGAGLPVIQTLRDLRDTGDEIHSIQGIFSGTLAYLFNQYDGRQRFSEIVRDARARGFTEPDPREDLSGMDVARKTIILAREAGLSLELSELAVRSLVPEGLDTGSVESFLDRLEAHDEEMSALVREADAAGQVLRYVGTLDITHGRASVELARFNRDHPFARINLTDNIVQFQTRRYSQNPLIIQGPGAGPEVTAGGVFADLLRLTSVLAGPL